MLCHYPRFSRWTGWRLAVILLLNVSLLGGIAVVTVHGTWRHKSWAMRNNKTLQWHMGLLSVTGYVACDTDNDVLFQQICLAIFKNVFGHLWDIQRLLCHIETLNLRLQGDALMGAYKFSQSCSNVSNIWLYSLVMFGCAMIASLLLVVGTFIIIWLAYGGFAWKLRALYWVLLLCNLLAVVLQITGLTLYHKVVPPETNALFHYFNSEDPPQSFIWSSDGGKIGSAVPIMIAFAILTFLALILGILWVPIRQAGMELIQRMSVETSTKQPMKTKDLFWAYMPEIFQPHVYVAEVPVGFDEQPPCITATTPCVSVASAHPSPNVTAASLSTPSVADPFLHAPQPAVSVVQVPPISPLLYTEHRQL